jgi:N6-adenosine-specific RNA methylase IME4
MTVFATFDEIPRGHYQAIYADPPWSFKAWSAKRKGRSAEQHYNVLSFDELVTFPIASLAADRCALFLWVVRSNLPEAMRLIDGWGFRFKSTAFIWAKTCTKQPEKFRIGFGKWTRTGAEQCWLATRGSKNPVRRCAAVRELITAPIGRHSEKPAEIYSRIEALVDGPYLELFGRRTMPGWDAFGKEASKFDAVA